MHSKIFAPILLVLAYSATASAAATPFKLPTVNGYAVTLPGLPVFPMTLPSVNFMVAAPALAPTLNVSVLPISAPLALPVLPAAAIGQARMPGVPSSLPLPTPASLKAVREPASFLVEMLDPALSNEQRGLTAENPFDGRRTSHRELELPHNRYF
jgi:hypothetical protein